MDYTERPAPDTSGFVAKTPFMWALERLIVGFGCCGFVSLLYFTTSDFTSDRHHELLTTLDTRIPFIPETIWIYFPVYLGLLFVAILGVQNRDLFYRTVTTVAVSATLCVIGFLLMPSTITLPAVTQDGTWTMKFLAWMQKVDVPNNTFPSQHVAISFAAGLGALAYRRWLGVVVLTLAVMVALSTMTTKQHYWIDSPGGLGVALIARWLVFRYRRAPVASEPATA